MAPYIYKASQLLQSTLPIQANFRMILFETTASIFEVMWDVALAYFVIRISFVYYIVTFLSFYLVAFIRGSIDLPLDVLSHSSFAVNLLTIALISRILISYYKIPRFASFRLGIGVVAMCFMVVTDICTSPAMYKQGWSSRQWYTRSINMANEVLRLLVLTLMPTVWMLGQSIWDEAREVQKHGQDKKDITEPMVAEL
jgi:hypothetical protein